MDQISSREGGFSLVEIMIAVVVISLLAMFAAPEVMNWRENMRVNAAARDLFATLNLARVTAIERAESVRVNAVTGTNSYEIFVDDGDGGKAPAKAGNGVHDAGMYDSNGDSTLDAPYQEMWLTKNANNNAGITDLAAGSYKGATLAATVAGAGFTPRGMPRLDGGGNPVTGAFILRNSDGKKWYRIELTTSGSLRLLKSNDSTNGTNGTWE